MVPCKKCQCELHGVMNVIHTVLSQFIVYTRHGVQLNCLPLYRIRLQKQKHRGGQTYDLSTSHFKQGTKKTRTCLTGHPVYKAKVKIYFQNTFQCFIEYIYLLYCILSIT